VSREGIVAQASPRRKALRVVLRYVGMLAVAAVISVPISLIGTFMMNPLLNRLEAKYGIELTGHSGPADWIFALILGSRPSWCICSSRSSHRSPVADRGQSRRSHPNPRARRAT
jgi:hypothetical protein